jgi:hypothetical protein
VGLAVVGIGGCEALDGEAAARDWVGVVLGWGVPPVEASADTAGVDDAVGFAELSAGADVAGVVRVGVADIEVEGVLVWLGDGVGFGVDVGVGLTVVDEAGFGVTATGVEQPTSG